MHLSPKAKSEYRAEIAQVREDLLKAMDLLDLAIKMNLDMPPDEVKMLEAMFWAAAVQNHTLTLLDATLAGSAAERGICLNNLAFAAVRLHDRVREDRMMERVTKELDLLMLENRVFETLDKYGTVR